MALKVHNTITVVHCDLISTVFTIVSVTFITTSLDNAHHMILCHMTNWATKHHKGCLKELKKYSSNCPQCNKPINSFNNSHKRQYLTYLCRLCVSIANLSGYVTNTQCSSHDSLSYDIEYHTPYFIMAASAEELRGYVHKFLQPPPDDLFCLICLCVAKDPQQINCCGKLLCKQCLQEHKEQSNHCPQCRKPIKTFADKRSRFPSDKNYGMYMINTTLVQVRETSFDS